MQEVCACAAQILASILGSIPYASAYTHTQCNHHWSLNLIKFPRHYNISWILLSHIDSHHHSHTLSPQHFSSQSTCDAQTLEVFMRQEHVAGYTAVGSIYFSLTVGHRAAVVGNATFQNAS